MYWYNNFLLQILSLAIVTAANLVHNFQKNREIFVHMPNTLFRCHITFFSFCISINKKCTHTFPWFCHVMTDVFSAAPHMKDKLHIMISLPSWQQMFPACMSTSSCNDLLKKNFSFPNDFHTAKKYTSSAKFTFLKNSSNYKSHMSDSS